MIDRDRLTAAVRRHDHTVEEAKDRTEALKQVFNELGLLEKDIEHVSTQRGLRLVAEIRHLDIDFTKLGEVQLDKSDRLLLALLSTAWVDGLVTGVRAADGEWADGSE